MIQATLIWLLLVVPAVVLADAKVEVSRSGMAVAAHPVAAQAAERVLEAGGNAADAAVAAAFAISVVEPSMNSIGGRNQILVRTPGGEFTAYNGMTEVPAGYRPPAELSRSGHPVIATPGVVSALARLHKERGALTWRRLLDDAIRLADEGFVMLPGEASRHASALESVRDNPGFKESMLKPDGTSHQAGELLQQPELARTLRKIARYGSRVFYRGSVARAIGRDMRRNGGFVTTRDLKSYRTLDGRYVTTRYRDVEVHSIAAPAGGGLVVKTLNILENFDLRDLNDREWAAVVNQALALALESMSMDYDELDLQRVVSKSWAATQASRVVVPEIPIVSTVAVLNEESGITPGAPQPAAPQPATPQPAAPQPATPQPAAPPHSIAGNLSRHDWSGESWGLDSHHTTHLTVVDCEGMVVSLTQTVGPSFGAKVITPGLGFVYASTMGSYLPTTQQVPGARPRTTIAPTIVTRNGEVQLVLGAAGGLRILSGIVQTISRVIDRGMTLDEAVAAPRIHPKSNRDDGERTVELLGFHAETSPGGWEAGDLKAWQAAGFSPSGNDRVGAFSRVNAIARLSNGWQGVSDPDWEGAAAGAAAGAEKSRCRVKP